MAKGINSLLTRELGLIEIPDNVIAISPITLPKVPASVAKRPELNVPLANSGDITFASKAITILSREFNETKRIVEPRKY